MPTKRCSKCGEQKPLEAFTRDRTKPDGYFSSCKPCKQATCRATRDPAKAWACTLRWREQNKERYLAVKREWTRSDAGRASANAWIDRNRESVYDYNKAQRAARKAAGTVTEARIRELKVLQKARCTVCRGVLPKDFHVDHIVPVALGGDSSAGNLQLLCPHCNCSKKAAHPVDFMQRKGYLL